MSSFTSDLQVTPLDGRRWKLKKEFTYRIGSKCSNKKVMVPIDFITDFASFPLWRLLFWWLPMWAKYQKGAVLHDWLYQSQIWWGEKDLEYHATTREEADDIFYEAMKIDFRNHKSGRLIAWLEWKAVRIAGGLAWR